MDSKAQKAEDVSGILRYDNRGEKSDSILKLPYWGLRKKRHNVFSSQRTIHNDNTRYVKYVNSLLTSLAAGLFRYTMKLKDRIF